MPQLISSKKYCLFNFGFLALSLFVCLGVYFISTHGISVNNKPVDHSASPSIYAFIFAVLVSHFLFTLLSWWYLFKAPPHTKDDYNDSSGKKISKKNNIHDHASVSSPAAFIAPNNKPSSERNLPTSPTACTDSIRILVVDDNTSNITVLENYLQKDNREIVTANNGLDAIRQIEKQTVDVIFMDIEMEGMSGPQTVQHIRALEKANAKLHVVRTPIIAVSAHKEKNKRLAVLQQDFDDYLEKPVTADTVHEVMQRWGNIELRPTNPITQKKRQMSQPPQDKLERGRSTYQPAKITTPTSQKKDIDKVINIEYSLSHSNNNNVLARDMLALLVTMIKQEKSTLLALYEQQQWEKLYQLNHKIYGGSSYCGVPKLQKSNQQLERKLQSYLTQRPANDDPQNSANDTGLNDAENIIIEESAITEIKQALDGVLQSIDDILLWDEQYDMDIIFNIE